MATGGAGLEAARRKLGSGRRVMRLTRQGTLAGSGMQVDGLDVAKLEMKRAQKHARNVTKVLKIAALDLDTLMNDSFMKEAAPNGDPWPELAYSTIRARMGKALGGRASRFGKARVKSSQLGKKFTVRWERAAAERARLTRIERYGTDKLSRNMTYTGRYSSKAFSIAHGGGIKILTDTGQLKNSLFARAAANVLEFGGNVHYLGPHVSGATRKTSKKKKVTSRGRFLTKAVSGQWTLPARSPVPVELHGQTWRTMNRGPAKEYFDLLAKALSQYILEPKVSLT